MSEDKKLIEAAKTNPDLYEKLYKKYTKRIYFYFWPRVGHDRDTAEDLTQETFIRAYSKLHIYEHRGYSYGAYLMGIARNLLVDHYRKPKEVPLEAVEHLATVDVSEDIERKYLKKLLLESMKKLSYAKRLVLYLYYWSGYSVKEIAMLTRRSENAVKLLLLKGRRALVCDPAIFTLGALQPVVA